MFIVFDILCSRLNISLTEYHSSDEIKKNESGFSYFIYFLLEIQDGVSTEDCKPRSTAINNRCKILVLNISNFMFPEYFESNDPCT
jgi:hypothetical protein